MNVYFKKVWLNDKVKTINLHVIDMLYSVCM